MSAVEQLEAPTLLDLLARCWSLGAPVAACAYDRAERHVAFALADGRLAVAPAGDPEPAAGRCRTAIDTGRTTVAPRRRPPPPITPSALGDGPLFLVRAGAGGILAGCGEHLFRIDAAGLPTGVMTLLLGAVEAMAPLDEGAVLAAAGTVFTCDAKGAEVAAVARYEGRARAIAPSPDGARLAVATDAGLAVARLDGAGRGRREPAIAPSGLSCIADAGALAWSPDGRRLAAGGPDGLALIDVAGPEAAPLAVLGNYPNAIRSLAWSQGGRWLVTGGAHRIIAWDLSGYAGSKVEAAVTGVPRFRFVRTVALHPDKPLVAAGYDDGMIVVAQIGRRDELLLKEPGDGAVAALAWSPDGAGLAFGTEGGLAGIADFPPQLFK